MPLRRATRGTPGGATEGGAPERARRRPFRWPRGLAWLGILGPGLIAANAGNDAGAIATYSSVGSTYGYELIWMMVLITVSLIVVQEMCARMGAVTGKGLSDLIRENFPIRWTAFAMLVILISAAGTVVSEFLGIAAALSLFNVSTYLSVPLGALAIWLVVVKGSYRQVEKIFLFFTVAFFGYIVSAFMAGPDWEKVAYHAVVPQWERDPLFLTLFVATVGTTIAPWMPMVLQSTVVEKGTNIREYALEKWDVIIGAVFADTVAIFIIISAAATLYQNPATRQPIEDATVAARALTPLAGPWATILFAVGMFGASMLAAHMLPLSTAFSICEAFGWESGVSNRWNEAPYFYGLFTGLVAFGALVVLVVPPLLPGVPLFEMLVWVQALNGLLLPILLIFIMLLVNDREIMGEHTNKPGYNAVAWVTVVSVSLLAIVYLGMLFFGPD
ncbi:MAG: Nramp family divalent metal transporter [Armatimonadetes bacterium]|nr:Nramp family divalent metal transporter [Armatimonadota bacterium]